MKLLPLKLTNVMEAEEQSKPITWLNDGVKNTEMFLMKARDIVEHNQFEYPVLFNWQDYQVQVYIWEDTTVDELFMYLLSTRSLWSYN